MTINQVLTIRCTPEFELAYQLARYLLRNKLDKQGRHLIEHSMRVSTRCADAGLSDEQQIAAILHDCVEDGELNDQCNARDIYSPFMVIDSLFGAQIYNLVRLLTRQESQSYENYIRLIKNYPAAAKIKLCDLADNLLRRVQACP